MCFGSGMKASLKLRDDEKRPLLLKAKIPLTIGGLPFFSAVSAGASADDLQLDLGTAFPTVPSARLSYRPNDPVNPFHLSLCSGAFGSHSPLSFHVDFNPLGGGPPSFFLHFKPRLGDFSLRKLITSSTTKVPAIIEGPEDRFAPVKRALEGFEVHARSVLPLKSGGAAVKFRWGVRVAPAEIRGLFSEKRVGVSSLPLLAMNKISVEYVRPEEQIMTKKKKKEGEGEEKLSENVSVLVREHMDALKAENGLLRKAVEELRMEVMGGKVAAGELRGVDARKSREGEGRNGTRGGSAVVAGNRGGRRSEKKADAVEKDGGDVNAELRKALMEAAAAGAGA